MGAAAWAIGWRKLARDDGRRLLHYGLMATALLLLNQRTWDHHAGVLFVATLGIWQGIAYGRISRPARMAAMIVTLLSGVALLAGKSGVGKAIGAAMGMDDGQADALADRILAYGPFTGHLALLLAAGVIVCLALKRTDEPYTLRRQKLSDVYCPEEASGVSASEVDVAESSAVS